MKKQALVVAAASAANFWIRNERDFNQPEWPVQISDDSFDAVKYQYANWREFDPLNSLGDAMRLVVAMNMRIEAGEHECLASLPGANAPQVRISVVDGKKKKALCRAITEAAAQAKNSH